MFSKTSKQSPEPVTVPDTTSKPSPTAPRSVHSPTPAPARPVSDKSIPSIISADLTVMGDLVSQGDIQVEGTVKGDIKSHSLTIGQNADVDGSLNAETVKICGKISGSVRAPVIALAGTARVQGDLIHDKLEIEAGAVFEGSVQRLDAQRSAPAAAPMKAPNGSDSKASDDKSPAVKSA